MTIRRTKRRQTLWAWLRGRLRDERGSVTLWALLSTITFTLIVGISVDLPGQIHAKQRATDVAAQAVRVAGQRVNPTTLMGGRPISTVDAADAKAAAQRTITDAGMTGTVTIQGGVRITVTTTARYQPQFLSSLGFGVLTVTGNATGRLVRAQDGTER